MKFACEDRKNYIRGDLELTCEQSHHLEYTCDAIWRGKQSFNSAIVSHNRLICTEFASFAYETENLFGL